MHYSFAKEKPAPKDKIKENAEPPVRKLIPVPNIPIIPPKPISPKEK